MSLLKFFGFGQKRSQSVDDNAGQQASAPDVAVVRQISVTEANRRVSAGTVTLIDVRRPEEWAETGRPKGSHGVTLQDPAFVEKVIEVLNGDKAKAVAFSCKSGGRSSMAAEKAVGAGLQDVSNVEGGFEAWLESGLPIDKGPFCLFKTSLKYRFRLHASTDLVAF